MGDCLVTMITLFYLIFPDIVTTKPSHPDHVVLSNTSNHYQAYCHQDIVYNLLRKKKQIYSALGAKVRNVGHLPLSQKCKSGNPVSKSIKDWIKFKHTLNFFKGILLKILFILWKYFSIPRRITKVMNQENISRNFQSLAEL